MLENETKTVRISIDCMGGDHGLRVTIPASLSFLGQEHAAHLILVGQRELIEAELKKHKAENHPRITIKHASEVVRMDDKIEVALRRKKDSSMRVAIELVKNGEADVCVSAGNTGALMAVSRYVLKTMPGVDRPAICAILPNQKNGPTYVLDLGANVGCEAEHLHQFALMGSALFANIEGDPHPRIGLLNVGTESIKGNEVVKKAGELLHTEHGNGTLNFCGNVEGNDIFEGTCDVVVCDGFTGNVTLKAIEGLGRFFREVLVSELKSSFISMLGALLAGRALKSVRQRLNPSRFNGACMLGLRGLVFKSHGGADVYAYGCAIQRAHDAVRRGVLRKISNTMAELLRTSQDHQAAGKFGKENGIQEQETV